MNNSTPPTILRNLYAKLETMEKELNENTGYSSMAYNDNKDINNDNNNSNGSNNNIKNTAEEKRAPNTTASMSPLSLPSNSASSNDMKKNCNANDKFLNLAINSPRSSSFSNPNNSLAQQQKYQQQQQQRIQERDYAGSTVRSNSVGARERAPSNANDEKDSEYSSPKINYVRAVPTPPSINTYYNPQNTKYGNPKSFPNDDNFNLEQSSEADIPRYYGSNYGSPVPPNYQSPPIYDKMVSPNGNSYVFSPDSTSFYNEMSLPNVDEYGNYYQDYKHQSDYSARNDYSKLNINTSFDLNADLEANAKSFGIGNESMSETFSDSKSFIASMSEIDMNFDPEILKGKGKKYMKDLVTSSNFHKGGKLTICTNIFLNKKKTLFYALTTHRLYAFKEDRSDAELISSYVIDKDTKISKAGIYAGVRNFELTTLKDNDKSREVHEFECETKEEKDDWIHSINKVIQIHKYYGKTLPTLPQQKETSYTSTLKTPNLSPSLPTPSMSPDNSYYGGNNSFNSSYKSPTIVPNQYVPSIASQNSYSKGTPMYGNQMNNGRKASPQPLLVSSPTGMMHNTNTAQYQMGSPNYMNKIPKNLPINQLISNQPPPPIQGRSPQPSPRVNYYQRSPMQRPQSGN